MQIMSKLLEEVLSKKNMILVYKSTSRVDNVCSQWWNKRQIETRSYKPQPVKSIEIPKPSHGVRKLGVIMVEQDKYHMLSIRDN